MFKKVLALSFVLGFAFAASQAEAIPLSSLSGTLSPELTLVYGGCGAYGHRGPYGHCRAGGQAGGYGRGRPCPPGWHIGGGGRHCWCN